MAMNTAKIDAEIKKLRDHIKKLEDLRRFTSDEEMAPLLESLLVESASESSAVQRVTGRPRRSRKKREPKRGDLMENVIKSVGGMHGRFTAEGVVETMDGAGFRFSAKSPTAAVNGVLRKLVAREYLRVATVGAGRTPNQYERLHKGSGD